MAHIPDARHHTAADNDGKFAGTEEWSRTITLVEGINNITITASDAKGNRLAESIQVTYRPVTRVTVTPVTPTATAPGTEGVSILFAMLVILLCWLWMHKIKRF